MAEPPKHFFADKKIIIAGAGIAGLAFAIALRKQWPAHQSPPQIQLFDRDAREMSVKREGASLPPNGFDKNGCLVTLQDLGLLDDILARAILGNGDEGRFKMWNATWEELISLKYKAHPGLPTSTVRIARRDLRAVLIATVEAQGPIRWGVSATAVEALPGGQVRVTLAEDGKASREEECDLLVAADGGRSKLRTCLRPGDDLQYAGATQIGGIAKFPDGIPAPLDRNWGCLLSGQGVAVFYSPVDTHSVVWAISFLEPQARSVSKGRTAEEF